MHNLSIVAIAGSVLLGVSAIPANALDVTESVSVRIDRSELPSPSGRAAVIDRIQRAASNVCHVSDTKIGHLQNWHCKKQVTEDMIRQANSPELLAQWQGNEKIRTASRN